MKRSRYALRHARKLKPVQVKTWPGAGVVRVTRADGTVVVGRAVNRVHDQVDVEVPTPVQAPD